MEPEGSLPHSQIPATCPYSKPARSSSYPHILLPGDPSQYYPPIYSSVFQVVSFLQVSHQNSVYASPLPHTRYMSRPSHSSRFYHPNNIGVCVSSLWQRLAIRVVLAARTMWQGLPRRQLATYAQRHTKVCLIWLLYTVSEVLFRLPWRVSYTVWSL